MNQSAIEERLCYLKNCTETGTSVLLTLKNGQMISRFRVHDIVVPHNIETLLQVNAEDAFIRGIEWPDHGTSSDRTIPLCDVSGVEEEHIFRYFAEEQFFVRNPLPAEYRVFARAPRWTSSHYLQL